ncbi:MAG: hypothetical protein RJB66_1556 [Pseudomonadota bacterium]
MLNAEYFIHFFYLCESFAGITNLTLSGNASGFSCPMKSATCNGTTSALAAGSCNQLLSNGITTSGIYWIKPDNNPSFQVYCEQTFDTGGYTLIADLLRDNNILWVNMSASTGNLTDGQKLTDARIDAIWLRTDSEKRLLIRCRDGGIWGSAVASNWYNGEFLNSFRSNCIPYKGNAFSYGATINGWNDSRSWYQQTGSGGCLHGSGTGMAATGTSVTCNGDLQFLIK